MRNLEGHKGIKIGGRTINNLRYADDTVLIAERQEDLQNLLDIVAVESKNLGPELNSKKTEVMVISRKTNPECKVSTNGTILKQQEKFKYLGTLITPDGRNHVEINTRIAQAKVNFMKMKTLLTNTKVSITTRKRVLQCYIEPILMYRCEAWTINKQVQKKLEATEMWFIRRMLRVPWTVKLTNDEVLRRADSKRSLINRIHQRQAQFVGHIMRRERLENLITTGKIEGNRGRERQMGKMLEGLAKWIGMEKVTLLLSATRD